MKPLISSLALLGVLGLGTAGCGGGSGEEPTASLESFPFLSPERATVAPGGTATFEATMVERSYQSLDVSVREGSAGGSVESRSTLPNVIYTAPATAGTYHVRVRFLDGGAVVGTRTATVTVRAAE